MCFVVCDIRDDVLFFCPRCELSDVFDDLVEIGCYGCFLWKWFCWDERCHLCLKILCAQLVD